MARCEDFPCCGHTRLDPCDGVVVLTGAEFTEAYWCDQCGSAHQGECPDPPDFFDEEDDEEAVMLSLWREQVANNRTLDGYDEFKREVLQDRADRELDAEIERQELDREADAESAAALVSGPQQGSFEENVASVMTNDALATRLEMIGYNRRTFSKPQTDAFLAEAAKRLRWRDNYEKHDSH